MPKVENHPFAPKDSDHSSEFEPSSVETKEDAFPGADSDDGAAGGDAADR